MIFFFAFHVASGKFGKQSSRVRAAKTFFFGITVFLYQIENPQTHLGVGRQFYASLINRHSCIVTRGVPVPLSSLYGAHRRLPRLLSADVCSRMLTRVLTYAHVCSRMPQAFTELIASFLGSIQLLHCSFRSASARESAANDALARACLEQVLC